MPNYRHSYLAKTWYCITQLFSCFIASPNYSPFAIMQPGLPFGLPAAQPHVQLLTSEWQPTAPSCLPTQHRQRYPQHFCSTTQQHASFQQHQQVPVITAMQPPRGGQLRLKATIPPCHTASPLQQLPVHPHAGPCEPWENVLEAAPQLPSSNAPITHQARMMSLHQPPPAVQPLHLGRHPAASP